MEMQNKHKCSICGKYFEGYGNNARPINDGICCDTCNLQIVVPTRIKNARPKVDLQELQIQREEAIKKSGRYCELRIIIGLNEKTPYAHFESKEVTSIEHALIMKCVDEFKKGLMAQDPISMELYKEMRIQTTHIRQDMKG